VVRRLRSLLGWKAMGHCGTLDPPADGVLIIVCGSATQRAAEFMELPKEYRARIRFGLTTRTDDLAGEVLAERDISDWDVNRIQSALADWIGEIEQVPPIVSAIKVGGKRSYLLVRRGHAPELAPRRVHVYSIQLLQAAQPDIEVLVSCSRGTYIRALARDIGNQLGWGGALASLTRTAVGPYRVETALHLEDIAVRRSEFAV
jgi:tRNA pseudouridine55 synthase